MKKTKKDKAKEQLAMVGRREWHINPTTRVKPNKKQPGTGRKAKHKGRQNADLWRFRGPFFSYAGIHYNRVQHESLAA